MNGRLMQVATPMGASINANDGIFPNPFVNRQNQRRILVRIESNQD
ncbi:MAG: hypothetical protein AB9921_10210 [Erysipelotrichaceae bacterium]